MADDEDDNKQVNASLDDDSSEESQDDDQSGKSSKKLLLLIAIPLLLLGGGGAAYFAGFLDPYLGGASESEEHGDEHGGGGEHASSDGGHGESSSGGHGSGSGPYFLAMPNQRVNLNSEGGPPTFLQLSVQLELKSEADKSKVEAVMPRVIDQFQTYLRELRVRDLKGSAGVYRLQSELLDRVNAAAAPVEVQDILFQEILIQEN